MRNLQYITGHSTRLLAQTTLRNMLGTKSLSEILSERETIADTMQVCDVYSLRKSKDQNYRAT